MSKYPYPEFLSREAVRDVDRHAIEEYGLPGIVLMENAGRGTAELLERLGVAGEVIVCAGGGNNGGDGFVIARHLDNQGIDCRVLLFADPERLQGDAAINYRVLKAAGADIRSVGTDVDLAQLASELATAEWIVDALLGTGTRGELRSPFPEVIDAINAAGKRVLAVDLPSGLDCDTGLPLNTCIRADYTATFVAKKLGFQAPGAAAFTGLVHVIDIGVPRQLLARFHQPLPGDG